MMMNHFRPSRRTLAAGGILALALGFFPSGSARAFDAQAFNPAVDPQGYWSVYSSRTAPKGKGYLGLWGNYAKNPFHINAASDSSEVPGLLGSSLTSITTPAAGPTDPLDPATTPILCALAPITDPLANPAFDPLVDCPGGVGGKIDLAKAIYTGNVVGSYALTDWFEVGIDIPVSYIESDIPGVNEGVDIDNIRLNGKLHLIGGDSGLGLGLVPFVELPTGSADHLSSNGDPGGGVLVVADHTANKFRASLNFGYGIKNKPFSNGDETDEILYGLGLGYLVIGNQPILGAHENRLELVGEIFGATAAQHSPFQHEASTPTEFLAGVKWYGGNGLLAGVAGGRKILSDGINAPDYRIVATVGYTWQPEPPPPPAPPPPPPEKVVVTDEQIITLEPIYFDFDKSKIKPVSEPVLRDVIKVMNERPTIRIRVESHTDSKGTDAYNQKLSERRANATVQWLISNGIDPSRLESVGYGESRPIATNDTDAGRAKNRRSEFHVISQAQG